MSIKATTQHFAPSIHYPPYDILTISPTVIDMDCVIMGLPRPEVINGCLKRAMVMSQPPPAKSPGYTLPESCLDQLRLVAWNAQNSSTAEALFQFG